MIHTGDLMSPGTHYYLSEIQFPEAEKSKVRMQFSITEAHGPMEHMEIVNAYVNELPMHANSKYVRQLPDSEENT